MDRFQGIEGKAGLFLLISAALHLVVFLLSGFSATSMLIIAVLYAILSLGLMRNWRFIGYIAFLLVSFGIAAAYAGTFQGGLIGTAYWGVVLANLATAICLFLYIWRDKPIRAES